MSLLRKQRPLKIIKFRNRINTSIYMVPNFLTTLNMFCGFYGLIHIVDGEFVKASYFILAAGVFDALDGRVARITHTSSEFGAQYDSLSDLISFCLTPSLLLFLWVGQLFEFFGVLVSFFYLLCGALRLARFNSQAAYTNLFYFQGLPSSLSGCTVASFTLLCFSLQLEVKAAFLVIPFLLGFLMISNIGYVSLNALNLKKRLPFKYFAVLIFCLIMALVHPEVVLFICFTSYIAMNVIFDIFKKKPFPNEFNENH